MFMADPHRQRNKLCSCPWRRPYWEPTWRTRSSTLTAIPFFTKPAGKPRTVCELLAHDLGNLRYRAALRTGASPAPVPAWRVTRLSRGGGVVASPRAVRGVCGGRQ